MAFQNASVPFKLTPQDMGVADIFGALSGGQDFISKLLATKKAQAELPYAGQLASSTAAYKDAMAKYLSSPQQMLRHLSSTGKSILEPGIVKSILEAHGVNTANRNIQPFEYNTPGQQETGEQTEGAPVSGETIGTGKENEQNQNTDEVQERYNLQNLKSSTDQPTRQKVLFAQNIRKTLDNINLDDLTAYNGLGGAAEKAKEELAAASGRPQSEKYQKYRQALTNADLLSSQVRQYYGDSIQPAALKRIISKFNPSGISTTKETAQNIFKSGEDLLKSELETYEDALHSTKAYSHKPKRKNSDVISKKLSESQSEGELVWNPKTGRLE